MYYQPIRFLHIDLHSTPDRKFLHNVQQRLHSLWCVGKDLDVVDKPYIVNLITFLISLVVSFLILADLQPVTNILVLLCNHEHA